MRASSLTFHLDEQADDKDELREYVAKIRQELAQAEAAVGARACWWREEGGTGWNGAGERG